MKLILKNGSKEMSLDIIDSRIKDDIADFIVKLYKEIFSDPIPTTVNTSSGDSETFSEHYGCLPVKPFHERDTFSFRERLPNNVIDISTLSIKQAVTESALVRCPKCGQSHAIVIMDNNSLYLMRRRYSNDEFGIVKESPIDSEDPQSVVDAFNRLRPIGISPENKVEYFAKLQSMNFMDDKDFNVSNDTEIFCPVCAKSSSFYEWKDAYENKRHYFEHEYVCGVCGSECVMDAKEEKDNSEIVVCTECGSRWLKEQV